MEQNPMQQSDDLSLLSLQIQQQIVCSACSDEFMSGQTDSRSLQDYSRLDVGFSGRGVQVWCHRHNLNVVHIDFEGQQPSADFRCLR